jgi:hypothetical protein
LPLHQGGKEHLAILIVAEISWIFEANLRGIMKL